MPHSHHSHSGQFCRHAVGTLEDVVLEAIRQGFEVYGLTEHVPRYRKEDLYPEEDGMEPEMLTNQFTSFLEEANRLRLAYESQISLLVGLETDFITDIDLDKLEELLGRHYCRIDYVVGSVHHVAGTPIDFDLNTYQKVLDHPDVKGVTVDETMQNFLCHYFDAQYEILKRFKPEIVGHIDLCRLYTPTISIRDYSKAWTLLTRNVDFAIEYGALFEANAAAFRKGWTTAYPSEDVMKFILERGGRLALSDDSHGPHAVGLNYHRMEEYLRKMGLNQIWFLERSETPNEAGRKVKTTKSVDDWWRHPFWGERRQ
ncbi:histidinol phosphate phosphatase H [Dendrothele bispora CBS 962.96]|uniref:Histidinol-phosphatase n=1 Tax=Dendrothele bispora (strain CBS 962.96) TaxID=1314807 RepID=A0A4S8M802_DENBC|nr:histidinol phosphate phosphatase H [Dendrothele bispora CBS 962.96]